MTDRKRLAVCWPLLLLNRVKGMFYDPMLSR